MYKIYINNIPLIITQKKFNENKEKEFNLKNFEKIFFELENNKHKKGIVIPCKNENEFMKNISSQFSSITAAGGIVNNGKNKYLMIYRRGYWDLPKGKSEKNESVKDTAVREVMEETGLKKVKITQELPLTYHTYQINKKRILKTTYWFEMVANGNQKFLPQAEEDIEDIKWFSLDEIVGMQKGMYNSVWDLMDFYIKNRVN